jgi:diaminopimelate epimerase
MQNLNIVKADPAGNITIFVLNGLNLDAAARTEAAKILLADEELRAEQVGFVYAPVTEDGLWRLSMMGGEFCGNAARSFGLLVARMGKLRGRQRFTVEVSGAMIPVAVDVDCDSGEAAAAIAPPLSAPKGLLKGGEILFAGKSLPVYRFGGISHVIAEDAAPDKKTFFRIKALFEERFGRTDALGVMFYDTAENFMRPAVYVYATESLIFESSCGSGTAALACYNFEKKNAAVIPVRQPGGIITARLSVEGGRLKHVWIGGKVILSGPLDFSMAQE